jgi:hypothetical protein
MNSRYEKIFRQLINISLCNCYALLHKWMKPIWGHFLIRMFISTNKTDQQINLKHCNSLIKLTARSWFFFKKPPVLQLIKFVFSSILYNSNGHFLVNSILYPFLYRSRSIQSIPPRHIRRRTTLFIPVVTFFLDLPISILHAFPFPISCATWPAHFIFLFYVPKCINYGASHPAAVTNLLALTSSLFVAQNFHIFSNAPSYRPRFTPIRCNFYFCRQ